MTAYYDLMEKRLETNRNAVDNLKKAEYIIFKIWNIEDQIKALGDVNLYWNESDFTISSSYMKDAKIPDFKEIKIILDDAIFSDSRLEVESQKGNTYLFINITDKFTGGKYEIHINMERTSCKRVEVSRKKVWQEEIKYEWQCE